MRSNQVYLSARGLGEYGIRARSVRRLGGVTERETNSFYPFHASTSGLLTFYGSVILKRAFTLVVALADSVILRLFTHNAYLKFHDICMWYSHSHFRNTENEAPVLASVSTHRQSVPGHSLRESQTPSSARGTLAFPHSDRCGSTCSSGVVTVNNTTSLVENECGIITKLWLRQRLNDLRALYRIIPGWHVACATLHPHPPPY